MSQIFPETVAASSNGTPCFSKLLMAFRMSQENIYCIYTNRDCFASFKSSHRLQAGGADVARGGGVAASGTLAERKAAHLSLWGCDRVSTRCNRAGDTAWVPRCSAGRTAGSAGLRRRNAQLRWAMRGQDPLLAVLGVPVLLVEVVVIVESDEVVELLEGKEAVQRVAGGAFGFDQFEQLLHGLGRGVERGQRADDELEADLLQLVLGEQWCNAALQHIGDERRRQLLGNRLQLLPAPGRLDEERVGAGLLVLQAPLDRVLQAVDLPGVRARHDEEVAAPARVHRGPDLLHVLLDRDDPLALHMAAALGPDLILQEHAGCTGVDQLVHRADHVQRVAVAGVGVDNDRDLDRAADAIRGRHHLGLREVAEVRQAELRGRHAVAGAEGQGKAGALHELRAQRVVHAWEDEGPFLLQECMDAGFRRHGAVIVETRGLRVNRFESMRIALERWNDYASTPHAR